MVTISLYGTSYSEVVSQERFWRKEKALASILVGGLRLSIDGYGIVTERPKRRHAAALQMGAPLTRLRLSKNLRRPGIVVVRNRNPAENGLLWSAAA